MKKLIILLLFLVFVGITIFVGLRLLPQAVNFSGLQVVASGSEADIYLDGKKIGQTPYENEKLHPGEYVIELKPKSSQFKSWNKKIILTQGAMTTVERSFSKDGKYDGGLLVYLLPIDDKMASVEVLTNPDNCSFYFNKESKGKTPFTVQNVIAGNQEVIVKKDGFQDRIYKIDTVSGYKSVLDFDMIPEVALPTKTPEKVLGDEASLSAKISLTPTLSLSPTKTVSSSKLIEIGETGTGWLRVRQEPTTSSSESAKVNQGQKFVPLEEQNGWIKIEYEKGKFGWISSDYVKKL